MKFNIIIAPMYTYLNIHKETSLENSEGRASIFEALQLCVWTLSTVWSGFFFFAIVSKMSAEKA